MLVSIRAVKFITLLSAFASNNAIVLATSTSDGGEDAHHQQQHDKNNIRRLTISSDESIALQIQTAHANISRGRNIFGTSNDAKPRYKLHAEQLWEERTTTGGGGGEYYINVKEATPAITSATTTSTSGGPHRSVNDYDMATLLVADTDSAEEETDTLAVIAVDKSTGNVRGIVNKENGEETMNFIQDMGNKVGFSIICCVHYSLIALWFWLQIGVETLTPTHIPSNPLLFTRNTQ